MTAAVTDAAWVRSHGEAKASVARGSSPIGGRNGDDGVNCRDFFAF
jgi:hypothetical protein